MKIDILIYKVSECIMEKFGFSGKKEKIMKRYVLSLVFLLGCGSVWAMDRCIGAVVNGQCIGTVMPDYTLPPSPPRQDFFTPDGRGIQSSPHPDFGFDGFQFHSRSKPVIRGGELRWVDPQEVE